MFSDVRARYALRCVLFGLSAFLVSLQASSMGSALTGDEILSAALAGGLAALSYAGIGAAIPAVEPSIGRKKR